MSDSRLKIITLIILACLLAVAARLFHLQVLHGAEYRHLAEQNRLLRQPVVAARGRIFSSDGAVLAEDQAASDLVVDPILLRGSTLFMRNVSRIMRPSRADRYARLSDVQVRVVDTSNPPQVFLSFTRSRDSEPPRTYSGTVDVPEPMLLAAHLAARSTGAQPAAVLDRLTQATVRTVYGSFRDVDAVVVRDLPFSTACRTEIAIARAEERFDAALGLEIFTRPARHYPQGTLAAHLVGYVGRVTAEDLERQRPDGELLARLAPNDLVGRNGLERHLDTALRGRRGERLVVRDYRNRTQKLLMEIPPSSGSHVVLTLDTAIQSAAENALASAGRPGAIVIMDCRTGAILALASYPPFDPNSISSDYPRHANDPHRPLVNRAIAGGYPPGSVFKVAVALAALESNAIPDSVDCGGWYMSRHFMDNAPHGPGVSLEHALKVSCNTFFFHVGHRMPLASYIEWLGQLGIGRATGIDLPHEGSGLLPTPQWKQRTGRGPWQLSDALLMSIGQGAVLVSPLQVARLMAIVANGGRLVSPHVVHEIRSPDGQVSRPAHPTKALSLNAGGLARIREGLRRAVNEHGGSAYAAFSDWPAGFTVAGKTGTAQRKTPHPDTGRPQTDNVGWFAGFAPFEQPRIVFAVAVEHLTAAESGGSVAAPIARQMLETVRSRLSGAALASLSSSFEQGAAR